MGSIIWRGALGQAPARIGSARIAGIPTVAFRTTHPARELERATVVLDSLASAVARLIRKPPKVSSHF